MYKPPKYKMNKAKKRKFRIMTKYAENTKKSVQYLESTQMLKNALLLLETLYKKYDDIELWYQRLQNLEKEHRKQGEFSNNIWAGIASGLVSGVFSTFLYEAVKEYKDSLDSPVSAIASSITFPVILVTLGFAVSFLGFFLIKILPITHPSPILEKEIVLLKRLIHEKDPSIPL